MGPIQIHSFVMVEFWSLMHTLQGGPRPADRYINWGEGAPFCMAENKWVSLG